MTHSTGIAPLLLDWHARHGRHDLPWQHERTPYRVWVSEIMLQQTQVATVEPYYLRFMARFPDVRSLAAAAIDEVLHLWAGLGYYARARNLHRAAREICERHGGELPASFAAVAALPGVGRSTAGAVLALATGQRHAILDGNARRVLARCHGVEGASGERDADQRLWQIAERETPASDVATYTQAIMDLGATVCRRRRPECLVCPLQSLCVARRQGRQHEIPAVRRRAPRGARSVCFLIARDGAGRVLLQRRPAPGIWGGLWCLPEFADEAAARAWTHARFGPRAPAFERLGPVAHAFTHFDLTIHPLQLLQVRGDAVGDAPERWYAADESGVGLPAPVSTLLASLDPRFAQSADAAAAAGRLL